MYSDPDVGATPRQTGTATPTVTGGKEKSPEDGEDGEEGEEEDEEDADGSSVELEHLEDLAEMDGMKINSEITACELPPFSSITMEIIWQPTLPGKVDNEFVFTFAEPSCENVSEEFEFEMQLKDL